MTHDTLLNEDWQQTVERTGGVAFIERTARETKAFLRAREIKTPVDMLRFVLAYCLAGRGLRSTAAWAAAMELADITDVALLYRLRRSGDWLALLVGQALLAATPTPARGRQVRIIDATTVAKAGPKARKDNDVWRIHSAFNVTRERFGAFELTDATGGERADRIPAVKGEILLFDRAYLQPDRLAHVLDAGADLVVRAGWKGAQWRDAEGERVDLIAALAGADATGLLDRPIWVGRKSGPPLALRLVAVKKPAAACAEARRQARRAAQRGRHQVSTGTLAAADWVILVTSLDQTTYPSADVLALYRLRWRIELGFKRLKSLIGLRPPPCSDERSARPWLLAHLLMLLLLEPVVDALEDSPRSDPAVV